MSSTTDDTGSSDSIERQIEKIGDQFLEDLRAGNQPEWRTIVAAHPDLAPGLEERLKLLETVYQAGKFLSRTAQPPTVQDTTTDSANDDSFQGRKLISPVASKTTNRLRSKLPVLQHPGIRFECPHCGNPVQLVDTHVTEVTCASCGSAVVVDPDRTRSEETNEIPRFINRFDIKRRLGRGGFGVVYLAHDPRLDRDVAIKIPRQGYFVSREEEQRFFREAKAAAQLSHDGIVQVHEVSVFGEAPFIVSEFVDGVTLSDLVSGNQLSFREIASLMVQVCQAVEYAHQHKVIHRDLKPSNILLDQDRKPHVADFGLARWDNADMTMTIDGAVLGTPAYMSPEQAAGAHSEIDARSDVYSLGVILYRLLCRELPFTGSRRMMIYQVLHDEPANPSFFNREIPRDLETITLKAMAKSKSDRYDSAKELEDELQRWLDRRPIHARPISRLTKCLRWCRRNPTEAALIATIASFLIVTAAFFWIKAGSETRLRQIADRNAQQAIDNRRESDRRLLQIYEQNGNSALEKKRLVDAAFWFSKSLEIDDQPLQRLRLKLVTDQMPKLSQLFPIGDQQVSSIRFNQTGELIAIRTHDQVRVFDSETGAMLFQRPNSQPGPHLAIFKNGQLIAFGTESNRVEIWNLRSNSLVHELELSQPLSCLVPGPSGDQLAIGTSDCKIQFWNVAGDQASLLESTNQLFSDLYYLDEERLLIKSIDVERQLQLIRVYNSQSSKIEFELEFKDSLKIDVSPDRRRLATVSQGQSLRCFDLQTGEPIGTEIEADGVVSDLLFDSDGTRVHLLLDSKRLVQRDVETGATVGRMIPIDTLTSKLTVTDDRRVVSGKHASGEDVFYLLNRGIEIPPRLANPLVNRVKHFDPSGRRIAIEYDDGWVRLWDLAGTCAEFVELHHQAGVRDVRHLPGTDRCVTISLDKTGSLWNIDTGQKIADLEHEAEVYELDVTADGKKIATIAGNHLRLWNGLTGAPIGKPVPHQSLIREVRLGPDGQRILTGCDDGTIYCWEVSQVNMEDPQPIFQLQLHQDQIMSLAINSAGKQFAATSFDGILAIFDLRNGQLIDGPHRHRRACSDSKYLDRQRLAIACGQDVEIWSVDSGTLETTLEVREPVQKLLWSPSEMGGWLVATDMAGAASIWQFDGNAISEHGRFRYQDLLSGSFADLTADHLVAAVCGGQSANFDGTGGGTKLFDPQNGQSLGPLLQHDRLVRRTYLLPDRLLSASQDGTARVWSLQVLDMPTDDLVAWINLLGEFDPPPEREFTAESFVQLTEKYPRQLSTGDQEIRHWNQLFEKVSD